ncbi:MAG: metal ABC transporter permease [Rhodothermales bacterium]|nr:metal ABC transporter permease [Rhodothermales bacterium]
MTSVQFEIQLIAILVAVACAIPGVFLVLRKMAMMSDAISHSILPGLVIAFFLTGTLNSPLLIVGATATGLLTVLLVESISKTRLLKEDAAIGLAFPVFFSIGVILIARFAGDIHLDVDSVLLGELAFAPFNRVSLFGRDLGPAAMWTMIVVVVINAAFVAVFYKELKIASFDSGLAAALGFVPAGIHYGLMTLVSATAVAAFDAVGSILVVALIVGPPATAYLLTNRLSVMIGLSILLGMLSAILGYWFAHWLDASIAGAMATMVGVVFVIVLFLAPGRGVAAVWRRRYRQKWTFAEKMLAIHLHHHEGMVDEARENRTAHLQEHFSWDARFAGSVVERAKDDGFVTEGGGLLNLTEAGRALAREAIVQA